MHCPKINQILSSFWTWQIYNDLLGGPILTKEITGWSDNLETSHPSCGACMASNVFAICFSVSGASDSLKTQKPEVLNEVHPKPSDSWQWSYIKRVPENPAPITPRFVTGNSCFFFSSIWFALPCYPPVHTRVFVRKLQAWAEDVRDPSKLVAGRGGGRRGNHLGEEVFAAIQEPSASSSWYLCQYHWGQKSHRCAT